MQPTPYLESNALLALQDDNEQRAQEALDQMLPGELRRLANAASCLARMARYTAQEKNR